nr:MAG TPA: hypothetical protein [Caudoviricetes sp.]
MFCVSRLLRTAEVEPFRWRLSCVRSEFAPR